MVIITQKQAVQSQYICYPTKEAYEEALDRPYADLFDITGRPMTGWVKVAAKGCDSDDSLRAWVQQGAAFAQTLPKNNVTHSG